MVKLLYCIGLIYYLQQCGSTDGPMTLSNYSFCHYSTVSPQLTRLIRSEGFRVS
jgi:hypothetical protein